MPPTKKKKISKFWREARKTSKEVEKWPNWKKDARLEEYSYYYYTNIPKERLIKRYKELENK